MENTYICKDTPQQHYRKVANAWHHLGYLSHRQRLTIISLCSNPDFNNRSVELVESVLKKAI